MICQVTVVDTTQNPVANPILSSKQHSMRDSVVVIKPEHVVVDFLPMAATAHTVNLSPFPVRIERKTSIESDSERTTSTVKPKRKLGRVGSDTVELMSNEHPLASSDSDYRMNPASESTTYTSIGSSPSTEEIPYMDSSSGEAD